MSLKRQEILNLFDEDETLRSDRPIRNYDVVHEDVDFMKPLIQQWTRELKSAMSNLESLAYDSLKSRTITPELEGLCHSTSSIMAIANTLKNEIVISDVEAVRKELYDCVLSSLSSLMNNVFFAFHPNADFGNRESPISLTVDSLRGEIIRARRIETKLKTFRQEKDPGSGNLKQLFNAIVSTRVQCFLLLSCFIMLIVLGAADNSTSSPIPSMKVFARIFSVLVATLWFQGVFMMSWKRSQEMTIWLVIWATLCNIWVYGVILGPVISVMVYAFPLYRLNTLFANVEDKSVPDRFFRRFSLPCILLWSIVGTILTHEIIWLVGLAVWISFNVFIRETSYRFFRQTYDLIEHIFSERGGRKQRELYFVVSSSVTAAMTLTGIVGNLKASQIVDLMGFAGNFSLILITILLAVQAVIPGINIWSTDQNPRRRLREIHTMLRANRGLGGFMVAFFMLFLLSNSVRWVLQSFDVGDSPMASLDIQFMTAKTGNVFDILLGSAYSTEVTLVVALTLLLVVCISLLIYCVSLLYYMFSTASLFLAPMLDTVLSTPVIVDSTSNSLTIESCEKERYKTEVVQALTACTRLNGCIIDQLVLIDSLRQDGSPHLTIHFHTDYPDKSEMYRVFRETCKLFYGKYSKPNLSIETICISFYHQTRDMGKHNIFAVQIDQEDWKFFEREIPGMSEQYKIEHIFKAKLVGYVLPESQVF